MKLKITPVPGHDVIGPSLFTLRPFNAVTRSGHRAVVVDVANVATTVVDIATVVVHVATRPRKYTMRYIFYKEKQVALIETISKLEYIYFTEHFTGIKNATKM